MLTNLWSSMRKVGETTDRVADLLLQGARGDVALDMVMSLALKAEGFRSLGRGEHDNAQELFASADRYRPAVMPEIVIAPDDRP